METINIIIKSAAERKELFMWKYIKRYLHFAVLASAFMVGEVLMDLIQPGIMSRIVDDGVLGLNNNGMGNLDLIWKLGFYMIGLVLFGGLCGSLNNVFVHLSGQNIGNEIRKEDRDNGKKQSEQNGAPEERHYHDSGHGGSAFPDWLQRHEAFRGLR